MIILGRLQGAGRRPQQDIADYVLIYRGQKLAVIEGTKRSPTVQRVPMPSTEAA
jgi:type I restriction enzyme R subunit